MKKHHLVGKRVEIPPYYDLWMRGARYGTIVSVSEDIVKVRMDHPRIRILVRIRTSEVKEI